jgi:RNA polymerase primary sigma factor
MTTHMENNHNDNQTKSTSALNQEEIQMYLKDIRKIKVMTPVRERELSDMMCSGNCTDAEKHAIYQELLEGNLRFVITVAKQYQNQGMELGDLIAEGNLGLMKAIKNFDWTKKLRFISYAVWWIKQSIIQSLNENSRMIRLPVNVVQDLQKAKKESQKNNTELDSRFTSLPKVIDLDMNINEEGDTLVDLIENTNAVQPDEGFNTAEMLKEKLRDIMKILDERERLIVEDYFGLSGTPRTLEDIGQDFNLTKERVRQIKEKALRKLRNESSVLFDYL